MSRESGEKLRGSTHVSEDESTLLVQRLLPPQRWIFRPLSKDYGVDAEIEWAPHAPGVTSPVTGQRVWVQVKSSRDPIEIRTQVHQIPRDDGSHLELVEEYVSFSLGTDDLSYSLRCGYPLLLFYADLSMQDVYWVPLREYVRFELDRKNPNWRKQRAVRVRMPTRTRLSLDSAAGYPGLRWFAREPERLYAFAALDEIVAVPLEEGQAIWATSPWEAIRGDDVEWKMYDGIFELAEHALRSALALEPLFGKEDGVPAFFDLLPYPELHDAPPLAQTIATGLRAASEARALIARRDKKDLDHPQDRVEHALRAAASASRMYRRLNKAFLVNEEAAFTRWAASQDRRFAAVAEPHVRRATGE